MRRAYLALLRPGTIFPPRRGRALECAVKFSCQKFTDPQVPPKSHGPRTSRSSPMATSYAEPAGRLGVRAILQEGRVRSPRGGTIRAPWGETQLRVLAPVS